MLVGRVVEENSGCCTGEGMLYLIQNRAYWIKSKSTVCLDTDSPLYTGTGTSTVWVRCGRICLGAQRSFLEVNPRPDLGNRTHCLCIMGT